MTSAVTMQVNFNGGVLAPEMYARVDTEQYAKSAAELENLVILPHGPVTRRSGLKYLDSLPVEARLVPFEFSTEQDYLLAFYVEAGVEKMAVFKDGVKVTTKTITAVTFTQAQILEMNWVQSADTLFIVHEDVPPFSIVRGGNDVTWTDTALTLTSVPQVDFNDGDSPTPIAEVQDITWNSTNDGDSFRLSLEGIVSEEVVWSYDDNANANELARAARQVSFRFPESDVTVAHVSGHRFTFTFDGGAAKDWDPISLSDSTARTGAETAPNITHNTLSETDGSPRSEPAWSATRGYPRTVTLHGGRIWFGGSKQLPQTLWGSVVGGFNQTEVDFDFGQGLPDDGIGVTLDTDQVNAITALVPGRHLQLFTTGGEFYVPERIVTPENMAVLRQTRFGAKEDIRPVSTDGATLFIQHKGEALREFLYSDVEQAYTSGSLTMIANNVINNPVDMDSLTGTADFDANYIYIVNADGSVAVFNTLRDQNIAGWTVFKTPGALGKFKRVAVVNDVVYFLVERSVNGATVFYVEELSPFCTTDSCLLGSPGTTFTGLGHLEGEEVRLVLDGGVAPSKTVSSGQVISDVAAVETAEIGLNFDIKLKMLPLNVGLQTGPTLQRKTRVTRISLNLKDTRGVIVDGELLPDTVLDQDKFDEVTGNFTGVKEISLLGWDRLKQPEITQEDPLPFTLNSVEVRVKVNG